MHVFVTGASGWIGSHTVDDLLAAGHTVTGLARSDASAAALDAKGVDVVRGDLDDLDAIRRGASEAEGVLHLANKHDWANAAATNASERAAVETIGAALVGTDRPFVLASGVAGLAQGRPSTEGDANPFVGPDSMRGGSENRGFDFVGQGVRTIAARFSPTTHGTGDHGFIAAIVGAARQRGVSGYVGDGTNSWSAVHVTDAARLVRLGLEQAPAGTRMHAVAETAIPTRAIAEAIGEVLGLPVTSIDPADADAHFGFIGRFFGMEMSATSDATRELLGWEPTGPGLLEDIAAGAYSGVRVA
ncbi:nucleoside-diphosphate-sugar epimerase [Curtobacterium sp. PhB25]|uniref:SDR family oxidoreductase n=1 Tax=unclassified Curtobacterium TaxID=257496 RepID=UPI001042F28F|nr:MULTISPECIES: SDR family oxidoreductase [unclassified Curtobacterium]TCU48235.1 nucleoside-diphosphate-sugar epimerase [Curtobacterium sp. PhB146]TCU83897.1 nucleoside-diphosphate-sugar epimerase [Curtobacterium sp. PhB191]TDW47579.1 nucleoside-diphosphate-sugar epimerase [Curtobacterium sp. PhB42]TDW57447.1 nucleoside-diphosphate-sugar epimerase [Curtobacterium sp. PhB190]TDW72127.1 nucleoside-diphosphate-sugar epimerase [Curtobacterium sp. PhB25]